MTEVFYYAYWNGEALSDVFNATAAVFGTGDFSRITSVVVLASLLCVVAFGAIKNEGRAVIRFVAAAVLIWFVFIVPKASVVIYDVRGETTHVVDNVPLGIAFPASLVNRIGYFLATTYEAVFSPVEAARFTRFGAVYPERVLEALSATGPVTRSTRGALKSVIEGCILPEALTDSAKANALTQSASLWETVTQEGWVNPARRVVLDGKGVLSCPKAVAELTTLFETEELPALKRILGAKLAPEAADPASALAASLPQAESLLYGLSRSMDESLRQSVLLASLPAAASSFTARADAPAALAVALSRAQGNLASEINYRTMASIARDALPKIRNAVEFVVIALFPVLALLSLASGAAAGVLLRGYVSLLLTVQLWPAVASVVNHLMIAADADPFGALAREFGGNTLASLALIRETGATSQAIAGALMCMVPVITYALVRAGDVAVSSLVSGLMAPAQSAAASQGARLAAGNLEQGNVRLGNRTVNTVSANKRAVAAVSDSPDAVVTTSAYGSVTRDGSGAVTGLTRTKIDFGVRQDATQSLTRTSGSTLTRKEVLTQTRASRYIYADALVSSDASERGFASALRDAVQEGRAVTQEASGGRSSVTGIGAVSQVGTSRTDTVSEGVSVTSNAGIGAGNVTFPYRDGASLGQTEVSQATMPIGERVPMTSVSGKKKPIGAIDSQGQYSRLLIGSQVAAQDMQTLIDTATSGGSASRSVQASEARAELTRAAEHVSRTHSDEGVRSAARRFIRNLSATDAHSLEEGTTLARGTETAGVLSQHRSGATRTTVDESIPVMQGAIESQGSAEGVLRGAYTEGLTPIAQASDNRATLSVDRPEKFGAGTVPPVLPQVADAYETSGKTLQKAATSHAARLERADETMPSTVAPGELRYPEKEVGFEQAFGAAQVSISRELRLNLSDAAFERGVLLLTRESYRRENHDKNYALRNAFFFGLGYSAPSEIAATVRERAQKDEAFARNIARIGSRPQSEISETDWKQLQSRSEK